MVTDYMTELSEVQHPTSPKPEPEGRWGLLLGAAFRFMYLKEGVARRSSGVS